MSQTTHSAKLVHTLQLLMQGGNVHMNRFDFHYFDTYLE